MISLQRSRRRRPRVEIVPMIDVMFFLVVFFMLFTTFRSAVTGVDVTVPEASEVQERPASELVIAIRPDGQIFVGSEAVTLGRVQQLVRLGVAQNPNVAVIIRGDRAARWEWIVNAMDAATSAGARNVWWDVDRAGERT